MDTHLKLGKFRTGLPTNRACGIGCMQDRDMMFASNVGFSTELISSIAAFIHALLSRA